MPTKPPGRCIFCGKAGLTYEHLLPDRWMRRVFARSPSDAREWRLKGAVAQNGILPPSTENKEIVQGSIFALTLHVVCKTCNNGWMHTLEDKTGPLLLTLIDGIPGRLRTPGQHLLARWLIKTAMVAEYLTPEGVTFFADDRKRMMESLEIPSGCKIWIAATTGEQWKAAIERLSCHGIYLVDPRRPHAPPIFLGNSQVMFLGLNTSLAVAFSSRGGAGINLNTQGEWVTGFHQIWPIIHPLLRYPQFPLRDEEINAAHRWFDGIFDPPRPA